MRVFVTGATGFVGTAIVEELVQAGHEVLGLTRSEEGARKLKALEAKPFHGDLEDLVRLKEGALAADAVIHCGFNHDFSKFAESCLHDSRIIKAIGSSLENSKRRFLVTSGIGVLTTGDTVNEDHLPPSNSPVPRVATEIAAAEMQSRGINLSLIRLPPSVHDKGDHGFVPRLIQLAKEKGISAYIGEGTNRWPTVHRRDAARLYRLALENPVCHPRLHAVGEGGIPFKDIAEVIARKLKIPLQGLKPEEAAKHFTWFEHFAGMNIPATAFKTESALGWKPVKPGLLSDMDAHYFD